VWGGTAWADTPPEAAADDGGVGVTLELSGIPYFYEPENTDNGYSVSSAAKLYFHSFPLEGVFIPGLFLDFSLSGVYGGTRRGDSVHRILWGNWTELHGCAFAVIRLSDAFSVTPGCGIVWNEGYIHRGATVIIIDDDPYSRLGLAAMLDITIDVGLAGHDLTLHNTLDVYFPEIIYAGEVRNTFHFLDGLLDVFLGLGVKIWHPLIHRWDESKFPHFPYFTARAGVVISLPPPGQKTATGATTSTPPDSGIDTASADRELAALRTAKVGDVITFTNIIFHPDQAVIKAESYPVLEQIAQFLKQNPEVTVELRGYTNYLGTPDQEQVLSKARAEAVKGYMLKAGIKSYRMVTIGYGSIFSKGKKIEELNRRVEIKILSK